jgi:hypothetical protein
LLFVDTWWQSWIEVAGNWSGGRRQWQRSSDCGGSDSHGWQGSHAGWTTRTGVLLRLSVPKLLRRRLRPGCPDAANHRQKASSGALLWRLWRQRLTPPRRGWRPQHPAATVGLGQWNGGVCGSPWRGEGGSDAASFFSPGYFASESRRGWRGRARACEIRWAVVLGRRGRTTEPRVSPPPPERSRGVVLQGDGRPVCRRWRGDFTKNPSHRQAKRTRCRCPKRMRRPSIYRSHIGW